MKLTRISLLLLLVLPLFFCQSGKTDDFYNIQFTESELEWIAANTGKVTVGFLPFFPILKIDKVDEEAMYSQYVYSLFKMIENRSGIKFKFKFYKSLPELLSDVRDGKVDMIIHVGDTPTRREDLIFSKPIISIPYIVVTLSNYPLKGFSGEVGFEDLTELKVAARTNCPAKEILERNYPEINIIPVKDDREGLIKLGMREVDAIITFLASISFHAAEMGISNLKASEITEFRINYCVGTTKDIPILADITQKVLDSFSTKEILELYNKRANIAAPPFYETKTFRQITIFTLANIFIITIIIIIFIWNRILRKKEDYQTTQLISEKDKLLAVFNSIPSVFIVIDTLGKITFLNNMALTLLNAERMEEYAGKFFWEMFPFLEEYRYYFHDVLRNKKSLEYFRKVYTERKIVFNVYYLPIFYENDSGIIIRLDDITEIYKQEQILREFQKMECIETFASRIVHSFNDAFDNTTKFISAIKTKFDKNEKIEDKEIKNYIKLMDESNYKAMDMFQQLLLLAHKKEFSFTIADLNQSMECIEKNCRHSFEKSIVIEANYYPEPVMVEVDIEQIERAISSVCTNAAHAMTIMRKPDEEQGGILSFRFYKEFVDEKKVSTVLKQNYYWVLEISDTGIGISDDIKERIFEPFFTTKWENIDTELELAVVYAIIKKHKGFIDIYSEINKGTSFKIFLPVYSLNGNMKVSEAQNIISEPTK